MHYTLCIYRYISKYTHSLAVYTAVLDSQTLGAARKAGLAAYITMSIIRVCSSRDSFRGSYNNRLIFINIMHTICMRYSCSMYTGIIEKRFDVEHRRRVRCV